MSVPAFLVGLRGVRLHTQKVGPHTHLVTEDHSRVATQFRHTANAGAETTIAVTPPSGTAIVITDIVLGAEKAASGSVTVQFVEGSDVVIVFKVSTVQNPVSLHVPFAGRWRGWRDARIDVVTTGMNDDSDVSIGYYIISGEGVFSFSDWDALR